VGLVSGEAWHLVCFCFFVGILGLFMVVWLQLSDRICRPIHNLSRKLAGTGETESGARLHILVIPWTGRNVFLIDD
jgi:hypothetical protein